MSRLVHPFSRRSFLQTAAIAGIGAALPFGRRSSLLAAPPTFEEIPPSASGLTWVHENAMSPERFLPETMGPGVAFFDYDNDGWMDVLMVNSGPADFYTPKTPLKHALYKNNRDGTFTDVTEKAGVTGQTLRDGRAPSATSTTTATPTSSSPPTAAPILYRNNGNGTFTDVTEKSGLHKRAELDDQRRLVRLRQRRPARSVPVQLRRVLAEEQRLLRRQQARQAVLLHPARLQADAERALPQQRRRHVHRRHRRHRHRARAWARPSAWSPPTSTTTA